MNLDSYMVTVDSDISKFNEYIKVQCQGLTAQGGQADNLLLNLFEGYLTASDQEFFVQYIKVHENKYNDGSENYTVDQLMHLALNKYEDLVRDGTWNSLTSEQEQIVALLLATVNEIKDQNLKLSKSLKNTATCKSSKPSITPSNRQSSGSSTGTNSRRGKKKSFKAIQPEQ